MSDDISIPQPSYYAPRRDEGWDPGTIRAAVIAGGLVLGGGLAYLGSTFIGHRGGEVPSVRADDRPIRVKPDNPGGMQIAGANNEMLSGGSETGTSKLAPAAETPDTQALRLQAPMPKPAEPQHAPVVVPAAAVAPIVAAPPPAAVAKPAPQPAKPVIHAATSAQAAPAPAHGKAATIQLAALETEAAARAEWQTLQKRMPDILGGRQPSFSKTERAGKTWWRVRTAGFADPAQAKAACDKVRAKGGACSVTEG